jgi:hypothetical protein
LAHRLSGRAFIFNVVSSLAGLIRGLLAYCALRPELRATLEQVSLTSLGIGSIALVGFPRQGS